MELKRAVNGLARSLSRCSAVALEKQENEACDFEIPKSHTLRELKIVPSPQLSVGIEIVWASSEAETYVVNLIGLSR